MPCATRWTPATTIEPKHGFRLNPNRKESLMTGAIGHLHSSDNAYLPVYGTAVGTGTGPGFAAWA